MRLLALDCSGDRRSATLAASGTIVASAGEQGAHGHAERLVPLIERTRSAAGWDWAAVDGVAVAVGPGSFTGVRIAVATARALALALDRPVFAVTTLQALVAAAPMEEAVVVPAVDARRGGLYVAWPRGAERWSEPGVVAVDEAARSAPARFTAIGSGAASLVEHAGRGAAISTAVDAAHVAAAVARFAVAPVAGPAVRALYVRAADATPRAA